jgi:hypothetical protein
MKLLNKLLGIKTLAEEIAPDHYCRDYIKKSQLKDYKFYCQYCGDCFHVMPTATQRGGE